MLPEGTLPSIRAALYGKDATSHVQVPAALTDSAPIVVGDANEAMEEQANDNMGPTPDSDEVVMDDEEQFWNYGIISSMTDPLGSNGLPTIADDARLREYDHDAFEQPSWAKPQSAYG